MGDTPNHTPTCQCHRCLNTAGYRRYTKAAQDEREKAEAEMERPAAPVKVNGGTLRAQDPGGAQSGGTGVDAIKNFERRNATPECG